MNNKATPPEPVVSSTIPGFGARVVRAGTRIVDIAGQNVSSLLTWSTATRRRTCFALTAIILFGALLRISEIMAEPTLSRDSIYYITLADDWGDGGIRSFMHEDKSLYVLPVLYYTIALIGKTGLPVETAGRVAVFLWGTSLIWIMYIMARQIFDSRRIGLVAALLAACNPVLLEVATNILREAPMLFGIGLAAVFAFHGERCGHTAWWGVSGFFTATAILSRYEACEIIAVILAYLLGWPLCKKSSWKQALLKIAWYLAGIAGGMILLSWLMGIPPDFYWYNYWHKLFFHITSHVQ